MNENEKRFGRFVVFSTLLVTGLMLGGQSSLISGQADAATAEITLVVPADAEVFFSGEATTERGRERVYSTPVLATGKKYHYEVRVRWIKNGEAVEETRKVEMRAGARVRVDFTIPLPKGDSPLDEKIAEEATSYAFPMVMGYGILYEFFINESSSQYKGAFNKISNTARVFTPKDTAVVTPNSDTPYSMLGMDLRAEPIVLQVPEVEKGRYFSVQLVDLYTCNYGYIGSRATGNKGGSYLVAGPSWKGEKPAGIDKVFRCETDFSFGIYRTQLFAPADIDNVKKVQAGYKAQPLSTFLKTPAPPAAPKIDWPKIDKKRAEENPFAYLNFILRFCPTTGSAEVEKPLRAKFATIGIEAGKPFPLERLTPTQKVSLIKGMKGGLAKIKQQVAAIGKEENGWRVGGAQGDRGFYRGNWTLRAAAAMAGIYGNDEVEALYPLLATDSDGQKADCAKHSYTLTFPKGQLPPVNAFWSVTMYDGKTQLLIANPINRYLINAPMLPNLKKNEDGSLTLYLQKDSPGKDKESNWLPAPNGPIYLVMRLYWPKEDALKGKWKPPAVKRVGK